MAIESLINDSMYLYGRTWRQIRYQRLVKFPLCALCARLGVVTAATVVDHIVPHRGNKELFFDSENLQSLCQHCHDSHKQRQEKSGVLSGCDAEGNPLDAMHPWFRKSDE